MFGRFNRERERLALRLDEEIRASLSQDNIPLVSDALEMVYDEFSIDKHPENREMRFFLGDLRAFSSSLIQRLRRLVSDEFPKWTVVPQFEDCSFVVTSHDVVFGDARLREPITADTNALQDWWAKAWPVDEARYGSYRRQLGWLKPLMPEALARLSSEPVVFMGVFERLRLKGHAFWLLVPNGRHQDGLHLIHAEEQPGRMDSYAVTAEGTVHHRFSRRFDALDGEAPAAWLVSYLTLRSLPGTLEAYCLESLHDPDGRYVGTRQGPLIKTIDLPAPLDDRALPIGGE